MSGIFNKLGDTLRAIKKGFFLKKHIPSASTMNLLKDLYPTVNWNRVDFYEGLPWFTPLAAPYLTAQALPQFYSLGRYRIYLKKFDETRAQCLADIAHEGFHILQCMNLWRGYGFGFLRGFMVYYMALFVKQGYRLNTFEIPAYDQEYRFLDYCIRHGLHGIIPQVAPDAFKNISNEKALIFKEHKFRYEENYLLLIGSFIFCGIITIIKPFADVLMFGITFLMPADEEK